MRFLLYSPSKVCLLFLGTIIFVGGIVKNDISFQPCHAPGKAADSVAIVLNLSLRIRLTLSGQSLFCG